MFAFNRNHHTVDGVMSSFAKTVHDLETISVEQEQQAIAKREAAADLLTSSNESAAEASRARSIAMKIRSFVSPSSDLS